MKAHEVRGLPEAEIKGMITDAETNLIKMRFQNAVGQLEKKSDLRTSKREIAVMKTVMREESLKAEMAEAAKILKDVTTKFKIDGIAEFKGDKANLNKAALRRAIRKLFTHPKRKEFAKEYQSLKAIANK